MIETVSGARPLDLTVAGLQCHLDEAGAGSPVLLLHRSTGPIWSELHDQLASRHRVLALHMSGYGRSERLVSARTPRDLGILALQALDVLGLDQVDLIGLGFGGWVAAEMLTMQAGRFRAAVLVGAAGVKPSEGFIRDPMMESYEAYIRAGFADPDTFEAVFGAEPAPELVQLWDFSREMTARVTWKPWMWSVTLPDLLRGVPSRTLLVWGSADRIVPLECGQKYARALPGATLEVVEGAGHNIEHEQPDLLTRHIADFFSQED